MDPQEYADARWHALLRAAVDLGVDEEDAPALVRRVLATQQRRIRRAEDPDSLVRAALESAVVGDRAGRGIPWRSLAGSVVALAAVLATVAVTRPDRPPTDHLDDDQVPSLFGYQTAAAERLLAGLGLEVTVERVRACEVMDRALGSDPPRGTPYERGDAITIYSSVPADVTCLTDYQQRALAWQLLEFASGRGSLPPFADLVAVHGVGDAPLQLARGDWADTNVLEALRAATSRVALTDEVPLTYAAPAIRLVPVSQSLGRCAPPEPPVAATAEAFTLLVFSPRRDGCPLRLEVYLDDGAITALGLYAGSRGSP